VSRKENIKKMKEKQGGAEGVSRGRRVSTWFRNASPWSLQK
jgi:hypothetical protein